jgi:hypothetical protein
VLWESKNEQGHKAKHEICLFSSAEVELGEVLDSDALLAHWCVEETKSE